MITNAICVTVGALISALFLQEAGGWWMFLGASLGSWFMVFFNAYDMPTIDSIYAIGEDRYLVINVENGFVTASHQEITLTLSVDSFLSIATLIR